MKPMFLPSVENNPDATGSYAELVASCKKIGRHFRRSGTYLPSSRMRRSTSNGGHMKSCGDPHRSRLACGR